MDFTTPDSDAAFMREALRYAKKAYAAEEVPVGAVVVRGGKIIARAFSLSNKKLPRGRKPARLERI